jgi:hypothetical protein
MSDGHQGCFGHDSGAEVARLAPAMDAPQLGIGVLRFAGCAGGALSATIAS